MIILKSPVAKRINFKKYNQQHSHAKLSKGPSHVNEFPSRGLRLTLLNASPVTLDLSLRGELQRLNFNCEVQMEHTQNVSLLDEMLDRTRSYYSSWHCSGIPHAKVQSKLASKELKLLEVEILGRIAKSDGVDILARRQDDINELFYKTAAVKIVLADTRFELARRSFDELLSL
jgi:hypothetical protein